MLQDVVADGQVHRGVRNWPRAVSVDQMELVDERVAMGGRVDVYSNHGLAPVVQDLQIGPCRPVLGMPAPPAADVEDGEGRLKQ